MSVIADMDMPKSCDFCAARRNDNGIEICQILKSGNGHKGHKILNETDIHCNRHNDCPLKSVDGLIEKIQNITPKAHIRTGKLSIDTELMVPMDKVIAIIKEYCGTKDEE